MSYNAPSPPEPASTPAGRSEQANTAPSTQTQDANTHPNINLPGFRHTTYAWPPQVPSYDPFAQWKAQQQALEAQQLHNAKRIFERRQRLQVWLLSVFALAIGVASVALAGVAHQDSLDSDAKTDVVLNAMAWKKRWEVYKYCADLRWRSAQLQLPYEGATTDNASLAAYLTQQDIIQSLLHAAFESNFGADLILCTNASLILTGNTFVGFDYSGANDAPFANRLDTFIQSFDDEWDFGEWYISPAWVQTIAFWGPGAILTFAYALITLWEMVWQDPEDIMRTNSGLVRRVNTGVVKRKRAERKWRIFGRRAAR